MLVKKQHAVVNAEYGNTIPKMLTKSSTPVRIYQLVIICELDKT